MKAQEAEAKFKQADALFRQTRYREALELLVELDRAFPNTQRVLYPMALSLFHVDCQGEALELCDRLIANFGYAKARDLKARIESGELPGAYRVGAEGPGAPPGILAPPGQNADAPLAGPASSSRWPWYVFIGVCVAILLGLPLVAGMMRDIPEPAPVGETGVSTSETAATTPESGALPAASEIAPELPSVKRALGVLALFIVLGFVLNCGVFYAVMAIMGHLLHEDVGSNIVDVILTELIVGALSLIPLIGWIFGLKYMANHYELSCGELLVAVVLIALFGIGVGTAFGMLFAGSLAGLAGVGAM
ncbi:MAG: hypothetical protein GWP08_12865 [Nitrospiraceae bacterium]|nr:hypothetical protein [Nitrospiraceae bacterium]